MNIRWAWTLETEISVILVCDSWPRPRKIGLVSVRFNTITAERSQPLTLRVRHEIEHRFQYYVNSRSRLFIVNEIYFHSLFIHIIWKRALAQLADNVLKDKCIWTFTFFLHLFAVDPFFQTFLMNVSHCTWTKARSNHMVIFVIFFSQTDPTLAVRVQWSVFSIQMLKRCSC
jgi:hypothetical protein